MSNITTKKTKSRFSPIVLIGILIGVIIAGAAFRLLNQPVSVQALQLETSVKDAVQLQEDGAFFLDVRQPEEWVDFHIPGSTLIPLGELPNRLSEVPKDQKIVVVCRSGNRSQSGRDILLKAGFTDVTSMSGGVSEWRSLGFPTVSGP
jgi:rhodanese-related sulfurtransferase